METTLGTMRKFCNQSSRMFLSATKLDEVLNKGLMSSHTGTKSTLEVHGLLEDLHCIPIDFSDHLRFTRRDVTLRR